MFTRQKTFVGMNELSAEVLEGYAAKVGKEEEQLIKRHDVKVGVASSLDFKSSFLPAALIHMHRYLGGAEEGSISLPCSFECETVLMMADISGYTALSRSLCLLGPDGVDLLSVELNSFFDTLVNAVHQHGGDVYKFAGDAVICFWSKYQYSQTIEELLQASIACSLQLIQVTHPLLKVAEAVSAADSDLDVSDVTLPESLGLHCAVGVGTMEMAGIGSPPEFIANGAPFAQVEKALSASERGELAISTEAWNALDPDDKEAYKAVDVSDGVKKLELVNEELLLDEPADPHRKFSRKELFESVAPSLWSDLLRFEPPIIQKEGQEENNNPKSAALEAAFAPDHPHAFMVTPQIRQVAIIFVNITPNKDVIRTLLDLHPILAECQATMKKNNAMLRQFLVDDKGIVLIAALGVPKYSHPDDVDRAVTTALGMARTLKNARLGFSIGISSGSGFCGCVGNNTRQEYAIIGSTVNLSAKIMAKMIGKNLVHCDDDTCASTDPSKFTFVKKDSINVKGFSAPVAIFEPQKKLWSMVKRTYNANPGHGELPSRMGSHGELTKLLSTVLPDDGSDQAVNIFLRARSTILAPKKVVPVMDANEAESTNDKPNIAAFVCARPGLGRTQFVKNALHSVYARRRGCQILWTKCVSRSQPFSAVPQLLCFLFELTPYVNSQQYASTAWDLLDGLISEAVGADAPRIKSTLRWLLLQQTDDGQIIQSPKSKSDMEKARVGSNAPVEEVIAALTAMVNVALQKWKSSEKGSAVFLVIEELQLVDEASWSLLKAMVESIYHTRLVYIFTSTEALPQSGASPNMTVELHPLTREDTAHVLKIEYDEPVDDETIDLVHASAGGSPYWTVELAKMTKRVGKDASHAMNAAGQFGLQKCILERYDMLTELQQDVLQSCAVIASVGSGSFSLGVILKLAITPGIVAAYLEKDILFSSGMENFIHIYEHDADLPDVTNASQDHLEELRFNHPMVQQTIYETIPRAERLLAHEKVATAIILEMLGSYEVIYSQLETIARHFELGLCHDKFIMYFALAVKETLERGSGGDLEALIDPVFDRIHHHHADHRLHSFTELLKVLEEVKVQNNGEFTRNGAGSSPEGDGLQNKAQEQKMQTFDELIEKARSAAEAASSMKEEGSERPSTPT